MFFAATLARNQPQGRVIMGVTATTLLGTHRVTVTGTAHSWVPQILGWVPIEEGPAEFAVVPSCVVLTSITHPSTHVARCQVYSHVKMAFVGVPMALTLPTNMTVAIFCRTPGQVMIEILTLLTVEATSVVFADAGPVHHALHMGWCPWCGCTLGGVSIAEAVATHDQLIQGIIVFLSNFAPWVEQVVPQCVQTSEVHPQVGNLQ